jgi:hypothetical protein
MIDTHGDSHGVLQETYIHLCFLLAPFWLASGKTPSSWTFWFSASPEHVEQAALPRPYGRFCHIQDLGMI